MPTGPAFQTLHPVYGLRGKHPLLPSLWYQGERIQSMDAPQALPAGATRANPADNAEHRAVESLCLRPFSAVSA